MNNRMKEELFQCVVVQENQELNMKLLNFAVINMMIKFL